LLAPERRPAFIKTDRFPEYMDSIDGKAGKFKWFYGSNPYVLSNKAMKIFSENVDEWMAENEIHKLHYLPDYGGVPGMGYFPDKFTGMILSMTGGVKFKAEMTHAVATSAEMFEGRKGSRGEKFWGYHYADPGLLVLADWRVQHTKLDRMINAAAEGGEGTVDHIMKYFRNFIDEHFQALRRDQISVKYVAERYQRISWPGDGNFAFMQFHWGDHYNGISPLLEDTKWYIPKDGYPEITPNYYSPWVKKEK
jgi:hypothetical protein